jgi:hypothetical protein
VKSLVQHLNGVITVESIPILNSQLSEITFTLTFPLSFPQLTDMGGVRSQESGVRSRKKEKEKEEGEGKKEEGGH